MSLESFLESPEMVSDVKPEDSSRISASKSLLLGIVQVNLDLIFDQ